MHSAAFEAECLRNADGHVVRAAGCCRWGVRRQGFAGKVAAVGEEGRVVDSVDIEGDGVFHDHMSIDGGHERQEGGEVCSDRHGFESRGCRRAVLVVLFRTGRSSAEMQCG